MTASVGRAAMPVDAALAVRGIAAARLGLGAAMMVAPRALLRPALRHGAPSEESVLALRMLAVRDLALGLAALLAARRNPGSMRGWAEAGALVDAGDALAIAASPALHTPLRVAGTLAAASATAIAVVAVRTLTRS